MFAHLYGDKVNGKIDEHNYMSVSTKYQAEQEELKKRITSLSEQLNQSSQRENDVAIWVEAIKGYKGTKELNAGILNELIEKIVVYEPTEENGEKTQVVEIYYRFVGDVGYVL